MEQNQGTIVLAQLATKAVFVMQSAAQIGLGQTDRLSAESAAAFRIRASRIPA
jgi:hypothetical protein